MAGKSDEELIRESLRAVLEAPGTSAKALAAKAQAGRQLALLNGQLAASSSADDEGEESAEDPMMDLWEVELDRRRRSRSAETRRRRREAVG